MFVVVALLPLAAAEILIRVRYSRSGDPLRAAGDHFCAVLTACRGRTLPEAVKPQGDGDRVVAKMTA